MSPLLRAAANQRSLAGTVAQELCGLVRNHVLDRSRSAYTSLH